MADEKILCKYQFLSMNCIPNFIAIPIPENEKTRIHF